MRIKTLLHKYLMPLLAIIALFLALHDAYSLLGVSSGDISPIDQIGVIGFILMGMFTVFRLFSAVGMWIGAGWGAPLLIIVTVIELALFAAGNSHINIQGIGLGIRIFVLLGIIIWFLLHYQKTKEEET
ncbi:MAG: hypothetical protein L3J15_00760 [Devosiaceae bacterium]|nr:hypothetical protein [Devosiaceae bacterium]